MIGISAMEDSKTATHNLHPDAQWYPEAELGIFILWSISSVISINISWSMIPGRALGRSRIEAEEVQRVVCEEDWNLDGKPNEITADAYWDLAKEFNPENFDPFKWCKAFKEAGATYVMLTKRHHDGFALWPSDYGYLSTKNYMQGRDLVKEYVEACRHYGLKVGLFYSPPDWYFDREYMSFLHWRPVRMYPEIPNIGTDLKPRLVIKCPEERKTHHELKPFNVAPVRATLLNDGSRIESVVRFSPSDHTDQKAYLNLINLPLNDLCNTVPVIKLEFDRSPDDLVKPSVYEDGKSGWI